MVAVVAMAPRQSRQPGRSGQPGQSRRPGPTSGSRLRRWRGRWWRRRHRAPVRPTRPAASHAAANGDVAPGAGTGRTRRTGRGPSGLGRRGRARRVSDRADHRADRGDASSRSWRRRDWLGSGCARAVTAAAAARGHGATTGRSATAAGRRPEQCGAAAVLPSRLRRQSSGRGDVSGGCLGGSGCRGHFAPHRRRRLSRVPPGQSGPCGPHQRYRAVRELTSSPTPAGVGGR